jgi:hypothetical protein
MVFTTQEHLSFKPKRILFFKIITLLNSTLNSYKNLFKTPKILKFGISNTILINKFKNFWMLKCAHSVILQLNT